MFGFGPIAAAPFAAPPGIGLTSQSGGSLIPCPCCGGIPVNPPVGPPVYICICPCNDAITPILPRQISFRFLQLQLIVHSGRWAGTWNLPIPPAFFVCLYHTAGFGPGRQFYVRSVRLLDIQNSATIDQPDATIQHFFLKTQVDLHAACSGIWQFSLGFNFYEVAVTPTYPISGFLPYDGAYARYRAGGGNLDFNEIPIFGDEMCESLWVADILGTFEGAISGTLNTFDFGGFTVPSPDTYTLNFRYTAELGSIFGIPVTEFCDEWIPPIWFGLLGDYTLEFHWVSGKRWEIPVRLAYGGILDFLWNTFPTDWGTVSGYVEYVDGVGWYGHLESTILGVFYDGYFNGAFAGVNAFAICRTTVDDFPACLGFALGDLIPSVPLASGTVDVPLSIEWPQGV